jgi:hypothetical protein
VKLVTSKKVKEARKKARHVFRMNDIIYINEKSLSFVWEDTSYRCFNFNANFCSLQHDFAEFGTGQLLSKVWHYYASGDDIILDNKLPQAGPSFI